MIVLFSDFGLHGPYVGQMKAVLAQTAPQVPVIDLFADAPVFAPAESAHLLAAYQSDFPADTVFLCVVDPGVGSDSREPLIVRADGHWYVGPGNGLFDVVAARGARVEAWRITWRPQRLSASFHGRDLFAPVAAMLAEGGFPDAERLDFSPPQGAGDDLPAVIYVDHYGNLISGLRAASYPQPCRLELKGEGLPRVTTFADIPVGRPLCYENSCGLLEIAVNQGRAVDYFGARVGDALRITA